MKESGPGANSRGNAPGGTRWIASRRSRCCWRAKQPRRTCLRRQPAAKDQYSEEDRYI